MCYRIWSCTIAVLGSRFCCQFAAKSCQSYRPFHAISCILVHFSAYRKIVPRACIHADLLVLQRSDPNGIRTRVTAVKGRCPRPLDEGRLAVDRPESPSRTSKGSGGIKAFAASGKRMAATISRYFPSISKVPAAAWPSPSAAVLLNVCRGSARTPCGRRAAGG